MRNYLAHFHFITKLLLLIIPPIMVMIYFTLEKTIDVYKNYQSLNSMEKSVSLSVLFESLVYEIQKERGISSGYLSSNGSTFATALHEQHNKVDLQRDAIKIFLQNLDHDTLSYDIQKANLLLRDLNTMRQRIVSFDISVETEFDFYTRIIALYLNEISNIGKKSQDPWLIKELFAYSNLLQAKERVGIERSIGVAAFGRKHFLSQAQYSFVQNMAEQNTFMQSFFFYANEKILAYYAMQMKDYDFTHLENMQNILLNSTSFESFRTDSQIWFAHITDKMDRLENVNKYFSKSMIEKIQSQKSAFFYTIIKMMLLNILTIVGTIAIAAYVSKQIYNEIKDQQNAMLQQTKMAAMGEMIGAIAHQWRQPLNAVGVLSQELEMRCEHDMLSPAELKVFTIEIQNYLEYMSKTINDFRDFFKPTKNKAPFNVYKAITDSLSIVGKQLETSNISIDIFTDDDTSLYMTEGYESEFKQVVINLINNAREAIQSNFLLYPDAKKAITIYLTLDDGDVIIKVCDSGGGIPKEMLRSLFELYVSTKHEQQGTGLGLYMSKLIIERNMLGHLSVQNIDGGAEFKIALLAFEE
ncbi:MAG: nitrate- and nitrite sensing domain-containing protein [Sulfurimonas sp.]|nr:nitrate- and nitrite sensing domain-containing protein [Sulfurimonas sp.]